MGNLPPGVFRICGKYRLREKIGSGSFGVCCFNLSYYLLQQIIVIGDVYARQDIITGQQVAVKMEPIETEHPKLKHEWHIYQVLGQSTGIPYLFWFGMEHGYRALVMGLLGLSLEELFNACNQKFSLKTILMLANQLVSFNTNSIITT